MNPGSFDFFFDFTSPYSYLAAERIDALAERCGATARWKPILLGAIFKQTGGTPLTALHPWKAQYSIMDFGRSATFLGLPYRHPSRFPQATQNAARALIWLQRNAADRARPFALEVFRTIFVHDGDVSDAATLARIAQPFGLDAAALAAATQDASIKQRLFDNNDEAARREVFGAPTFVLDDGERFWGVDRLPQLEARLRERAA